MSKMDDKSKELLFKNNPHLKKYCEYIRRRMREPIFYSKLSLEVRGEEYPNLIYPGKGSIFFHNYLDPSLPHFLRYARRTFSSRTLRPP